MYARVMISRTGETDGRRTIFVPAPGKIACRAVTRTIKSVATARHLASQGHANIGDAAEVRTNSNKNCPLRADGAQAPLALKEYTVAAAKPAPSVAVTRSDRLLFYCQLRRSLLRFAHGPSRREIEELWVTITGARQPPVECYFSLREDQCT